MRGIGSEVHTTGLGLNGTTTTNVVCSAYIWQDYHRSEYTWIKRTGSVYNFLNQLSEVHTKNLYALPKRVSQMYALRKVHTLACVGALKCIQFLGTRAAGN